MYKPGDTLKGLGRQGGEGQRYEVGGRSGPPCACCVIPVDRLAMARDEAPKRVAEGALSHH